MTTTADLAYGDLPGQLADLHMPDADDAPALVYFHGGGLEGGERTDNPGLLRGLVDAGIGVAAASYRLYPHARYPEFVQDAAACVAWASTRLVGRPLLVGGSSAGAYLAMMLRFDPRWLDAHGVSPDAVDGWVFDAGQPTVHYNVLRERGADPRQVVVDDGAPIFHVGAHVAPRPTLITAAEHEIAGRREQLALLVSAMQGFAVDGGVRTVVLDGYQHCEYLGDPAGQRRFVQLVRETADAAVRRCRADASTSQTSPP